MADNGYDVVKALNESVNKRELTNFIAKEGDNATNALKYKLNSTGTEELVVADDSFLRDDGSINWHLAPNEGRVPGTETYNYILTEGTYIDRYGPLYGNYVAPFITPYSQRALPYAENPQAYHVYVVSKDISGVTMSEVAEAFTVSGGGVQYELPQSIKSLIEDGYLMEVI